MKILDVPQSGSIAGQTSSRNRFGQYRRTRAVPVNPNTIAQQDTRGQLSLAAALWRTITQVQKDAWNYLAASVPKVDSLGQTYFLTGFQTFVSVNSLLTLAGGASQGDVPVPTFLATPTISIDEDSIAGPPAIAFTPTPVPADSVLLLYCSPPVAKGVSFQNDFRLISVIPAAETSPFDVNTDIVAKFGTLVVGQRYFLKLKALQLTGTSRGQVTPFSTTAQLDLVA